MVLDEFGGPERLRPAQHDDPKVGPDEALIRVRAAGVNPVDWKIGAGYLDGLLETRFPIIPGWDVSGIVEEVGLDAGEFAVGDEVIGYLRKDQVELGTYAELVAANVRLLTRKPAALSWEQAAGLPLAGLTAYQSLRRLGVGAADTVLIHGAAGGVGSLGTQIARFFGAGVIGTGSEHNDDFLRDLGAQPVRYGDGLVRRVRELAPGGVDAALDLVGSGEVALSRELLTDHRRVASITDPSPLDTGGEHVWVRPSADDLTALARLADEGELKVTVDRVLPLTEAAEAWRLSQAGHVRGKIVLRVS